MKWISRTLGVLVAAALVAGAVFALANIIPAGNLAGGPHGGLDGPVKLGTSAAAEKAVAGDGADRRSLGGKPAGGGEGGHGGASLARALPTAAKDVTILVLGGLAFWALHAWLTRRGVKQHRSAVAAIAPDSR